MKSLHNTTANGATKNVKDIQFWGNGDTFKLISKASSEQEGWMKSTKAMQIDGVGCVIQVTTQQKCVSEKRLLSPNELEAKYPEPEYRPSFDWVLETDWTVAEALTFVPGVYIEEIVNKEGNVIERKIVKMKY
jgi:hypothetical protein